jgi:hypothetical protein
MHAIRAKAGLPFKTNATRGFIGWKARTPEDRNFPDKEINFDE